MDIKYLIRVIGTNDYYERYTPLGTTKEKAIRLTKEEADKIINNNILKNKGVAKLEKVEVSE
jgi:hypothetical protein